MDLPGRRLGKYEIEQLLGKGGMAAVYLGRDTVLQREVAVKVLLPALGADRDLVARFAKEARTVAQLDHPHIVPVFDFGQEGDLVYFVSPVVRGSPLSQMIAARPLAIETVESILRQVGSALDYAHTRGLVHRDVKPSNILVMPNGDARLMDFGIAKLPGTDRQTTRTGHVLGTLDYLAPESIQGEAVGPPVDIYALGLVAFEMLSGKRPFEGRSDFDLMRAKVEGRSLSLQDLRPDLPSRLAQAVHKAFSQSPSDRFPTAQAFVDAAFARVDSPGHESLIVRIRRGIKAFFGRSHAPEPPREEPPVPAPASGGEFTTVFKTAPAAPADALAEAVPAESNATGVFRFSPAGAAPKTAASMPDVAVTIANSRDVQFIGRKSNIASRRFTIGRDPASDLVLSFDTAVSRNHAEILYEAQQFWVHDLGTKNGTFVNGMRLAPAGKAPLLFGSRILIGSNTELVFVSNELDEIADLTGEVIGGRFRLEDRLHASAKAVVYAATDLNLDAPAAVKILSPKLAGFPGYRDQFTREASTASRLWHQHICPVIDFGETEIGSAAAEKSLYVAMKRLDGRSLQERLSSDSVPPATIVSWLESLGSALDYMHAEGIVHGAIKPSAIVFDRSGSPYLTDFAFAATPGEGEDRAVIGSPAFLAPEQWDGAELVSATDQYSLAAVTYLIVSGSPPFAGQENPTVRASNLERGPAPVHETASRNGRSDVPPALSTVFSRALARSPQDRYPSAAAFAGAFRTALAPAPEPQAIAPRRPLVFISHHRGSSAPLAILLRTELERLGYDAFVDSQQQDTVGRFPEKIEHAIERCDVFLCLLGKQSLKSPWVCREIESAVTRNKLLLPVFQDGWTPPRNTSQLPDSVRRLLDHDAVALSLAQRHMVKASFDWLADSLRQLMDRPPS